MKKIMLTLVTATLLAFSALSIQAQAAPVTQHAQDTVIVKKTMHHRAPPRPIRHHRHHRVVKVVHHETHY